MVKAQDADKTSLIADEFECFGGECLIRGSWC